MRPYDRLRKTDGKRLPYAGPAGKDAYAREPMPWGSDQQQADQADQADQVGALVRWTDHEASIIAFNNSDTPARITVEPRDLPFAWETSSTQAGMMEAWLVAPDAITRLSSPSLTVLLPPLSAAMFLRSAGG